jgi:hypothetical protein
MFSSATSFATSTSTAAASTKRSFETTAAREPGKHVKRSRFATSPDGREADVSISDGIDPGKSSSGLALVDASVVSINDTNLDDTNLDVFDDLEIVEDMLLPALPDLMLGAAMPSEISIDDLSFPDMCDALLNDISSVDTNLAGDGVEWMESFADLADIYMNDKIVIENVTCEDEVPVRSLKEDVENRVSLCNFFPHLITSLYNLPVCDNPICNLHCNVGQIYCMKCKECGQLAAVEADKEVRQELERGLEDVEDIGAHSTDDVATGVSSEHAKAVMESDNYKQLLRNPCKSPRNGASAYSNSTAVRNQLGNGIFPLGFRSFVLSSQRSFQLHLIPPIVHVLLHAFGYKKKDHAPLRELICAMILNGKLPLGNRFFFTRVESVIEILKESDWDIASKTLHEHTSIVIWATLSLLDLLAYGETYSMLDLLSNIF